MQGDVYTEFRQQFNETVFQTIRVYNDRPYIEFDYVVGPIYPWYPFLQYLCIVETLNKDPVERKL